MKWHRGELVMNECMSISKPLQDSYAGYIRRLERCWKQCPFFCHLFTGSLAAPDWVTPPIFGVVDRGLYLAATNPPFVLSSQ